MCSWAEIYCAATNVNITLRIGNLDFVLFELIVNGKVDLAREFASTMDQCCSPRPEFKLEPVFAKLYKPDTRRGRVQNVRDAFSSFKQRPFDFPNVHIEGNGDRNSKTHFAFAVSPIHNVFSDQFRIGNDDVDVVVS